MRITPVTQRFSRQPLLEQEFTRNWLVKKSIKLTRYSLVAVLLLAVVYLIIEAIHTIDVKVTIIRAVLVGLGALFLVLLHNKLVMDRFQLVVCLVVFFGGLAKTVIIDQSGEFGQTFFQLGILLVLRIRFIYALGLSVLDLIIFITYTKIQHSSTSAGFFIYILFVLVFAASGCYALQVCAYQRTHS